MRVLLCLLVLTGLAWAVPVEKVVNPRHQAGWVSDGANLLSPAARNRINTLLTGLESTQGTEMAVVTLQDTDGKTPKEFATALFNHWGIGKKGVNNGVLLLVVQGAHRVEIEVGQGARTHLTDAEAASLLQTHVVPHFKAQHFEKGIEEGVRAAVDELRSVVPPAHRKTDGSIFGILIFFAILLTPFIAMFWIFAAIVRRLSQKRPVDAPPGKRTAMSPWLVACPVLLVGWMTLGPVVALGAPVLLLGAWRVMRYRPRRCTQCGAQMRLLNEVEDDAYLTPGQIAEEVSGSINYDVHLCPGCDRTEIRPYKSWFSGLRVCPSCSFQTLKVISNETLVSPSYSSSGTGRRSLTCQHCSHRTFEDYTIAMLSDSSSSDSSSSSSWSSSSSDFGGGSSSGGGAGASW